MIRSISCRLRYFFLTTSALTILLVSTAVSETEVDILTLYFDLLASGNYESAAGLWAPSSRERSQRFGISYDDIVLKSDCSSPIVRDLELMKNYLQPPVKGRKALQGQEYVELEYSALVNNRIVQHFYYMHNDGQYYWLIYPQDYYCREWPVKETKYLRIRYHPSLESYLHEVVLEEADRFIKALADSLGIGGSDLKLIEQKKIEYFYCDSEETVERITGFKIKGTYDLPSDDIISAFFPHSHELAHFLINYRLRDLPLYTLPLMREGLAVYYAGRWGKSPATLTELAVYLFKYEIISTDSILTMRNFDLHAGSDIAYPAAGLFIDFLMAKMKSGRLLDLYMRLSGSFEQVVSLSSDDVRQAIVASTESANWGTLMAEFAEYNVAKLENRGVVKPGSIEKGKSILEDGLVKVSSDKEWISFECGAALDTKLEGNLLFGFDERLRGAASSLFDEQYNREIPFEGYRFGVRFDQNEAGLYDYATNHMVAKYIWGISPSEEYFSEGDNRIRVRFKKELVGRMLPGKGSFRLLPR